MKWLFLILGGLALLVAIVALIGSRLPREHVASRTMRVGRPPQDVWTAFKQVTAASSVPVDLVEEVPPLRLVTRVKDTEKMFGGTWTCLIAPSPGGSTITITEDGWVGNPVFRFMARFVFGHHASIDGVLKDIAKRLNEQPALTGE